MMHLLYCDETNLDERSGRFLIYGGLLFNEAAAKNFHAKMESRREAFRLPKDYLLKFNPKPEQMSHNDFKSLKSAIIQDATEVGARLLVYAILHDCTSNPDEARRYGINTVCFNFNQILEPLDSYGIVLLDRFNDEGNQIHRHLTEKFLIGVKYQSGREKRLSRILGFHMSAIGQSHFCSTVDIVLGSLRFAINAHSDNDEERLGSARTLLNLISPLFIQENSESFTIENSFTLRPQIVIVDRYAQKYKALKDFLSESGIRLSQ